MFENLPRALTILKDTKQVIKGGIAVVVLLAISIGMLAAGNDVMALAFGAFAVMFGVGVAVSLVTILNLRSSGDTSFTAFQTNTNVNYRVPDYADGTQAPSVQAQFPAPVAQPAPQQQFASPPQQQFASPLQQFAAPPAGAQQYAAPPAEVPFFATTTPQPAAAPAAPAQYAPAQYAPAPATAAAAAPAALPAGVLGWIGPIFVHDGMVAGWQIMGKETNKSGGNTLVLTTTGIVVMMLGPDDMGNSGVGDVRSLLGNVLQFAPQDSLDKGTEFEVMYVDKWANMVTPLLADLPTALANHFNYTVPFAAMERIEVSSGHTNAGLKVHLRTGKAVKFVALRSAQLSAAAAALRPYVPVS